MMRAYATALAGLLVCGVASAQVQRTFVASYGSDANTATNCGFANPCRGFAAAQAVTQEGGEIIALDAAGYGPIAITKSITLTANPGFYAGISASSGAAVTIDENTAKVVLRGLNINGVGGSMGILMTDGIRLTVENSVISGFSGAGIKLSSDSSKVKIVNTTVRGNGAQGIYVTAGDVDISTSKILDNGHIGVWVFAAGGSNASATVSDTVSSGNQWGFVSSNNTGTSSRMMLIRVTASGAISSGVQTEGGTLTIGYSNISNNFLGFNNSSGTLETLGNNLLRGNVSDTAGVITTVSGR